MTIVRTRGNTAKVGIATEGQHLEDVNAGTNITIDKTDPLNPIINSTGGGGSRIVTIDDAILQSDNGKTVYFNSLAPMVFLIDILTVNTKVNFLNIGPGIVTFLAGTATPNFTGSTTLTTNESAFIIYETSSTPTLSAVGGYIQTVASAATVTALSTNDYVNITAQAEALTLANPTGTPTNFAMIVYRIEDNGTARAISFDTQFRALGTTLPTTTVLGLIMYIVTVWHSGDSRWDVVSVIQQA